MIIDRKKFHTYLGDSEIDLFYIKNSQGMQIAITNYGARIVSIIAKDKQGNEVDTVLGFDSIEKYLKANESYFGATVGRYANRIAKGKFVLANTTYELAINNGINHLHGGIDGFHKKVWQVEHQDNHSLTLSYLSKDGEENYPGNLKTTIFFSINETNELSIQYEYRSDKTTIANITNHAFFNLNGEGNGNVLDHILQINADEFLPIDETSIPFNKSVKVEKTPFDFRTPKPIGQDIEVDDIQIKNGTGYDHCFVLKNNKNVEQVASCYSPNTGICLEVFTDMPGVQLYTGNWLGSIDKGKAGKLYGKREAFCLETQFFPNTPNETSFPSCIVMPNKTFKTTTIYKYSIKH